MSVSYNDKIKVFINCGGKCGFPQCFEHLVEENSIVGQIAHINASSDNGPRGNSVLTEEQRNHPDNLLALCNKHHKIVDDHPEKYPTKELLGWKSAIEDWAKNAKDKAELSVSLIRGLFSELEIKLDNGNSKFVLESLASISGIISSLNNEAVNLEFEILECKALMIEGKIPEVKEKYESLNKRFPNDPRFLLHLAEIQLDLDDSDRNEELLTEAEKIDKDFWLLRLERLIRKYRLNEPIDISDINEDTFPTEKRAKSNFYRIYALCFDKANNEQKADEFIEKAIISNPDRYSNYEVKLNILDKRRGSKAEKDKIKYNEYLEFVSKKAAEFNNTNPRVKLGLSYRKLLKSVEESDAKATMLIAKDIFEQILSSFFDHATDSILSTIFESLSLPYSEFEKFLEYIQSAKKPTSNSLSKSLIIQFCLHGKLLSVGKEFFNSIKNSSVIEFINSLEQDNDDEAITYLREDEVFMYRFASDAKEFPRLREKIIKTLPDDGPIEKNKLLIKFHYDQNDIDQAYKILGSIDLSHANHAECGLFYDIANQKVDHFLKGKILERLLEIEKDEAMIVGYKLNLSEAYFYTKRYTEVIRVGKELLKSKDELTEHNREALLRFILESYFHKGEYPEGVKFIQDNSDLLNTFPLKMLEAEIYIGNGDGDNAAKALTDGFRILGNPSEDNYANLFYHIIRIDSLSRRELNSEKIIAANRFIKLKDTSKWYFVGDDASLDATKIATSDQKYDSFFGKKIGENVVFPSDEYTSHKDTRTIELIYNIDDYIFWQIRDKFNNFAKDGRLDGVQMIEFPVEGENADPSYLLKFFEDQNKDKKKFFEMYCSGNMPLSFLATSEGSLFNAIGKIMNENVGFIKCMPGTIEDITKQQDAANKAIEGQEVILDATAALMLVERGLFQKIYTTIPNIKVPQSVVAFMLDALKKFEISPGHTGYMGYSNGTISYNQIKGKDNLLQIKERFAKAVKLIEDNTDNIIHLPNSSITDCFSEKNISPELRDACIASQERKSLILTEDFLYLQANNIETKKGIPEHFSSISLVKLLFDRNLLSLSEYLDYFYYLSSYRVHFLQLSIDDLEKAVIVSNDPLTIKPENLRYFNLKLVLSKEYGVDSKTSLSVITKFLIKIVNNNLLSTEHITNIFDELNSQFFRDNPSYAFLCVQSCEKTIVNMPRPIGTALSKQIKNKLEALKVQVEKSI
jgi:tetratricopeptide (TPR) repeat protein